jgi:hypothetical protein
LGFFFVDKEIIDFIIATAPLSFLPVKKMNWAFGS